MLDADALDMDALAALLRWYVDAGVDCPVGEAVVDRFQARAETRDEPAFAPPPVAPRPASRPAPAKLAPANSAPANPAPADFAPARPGTAPARAPTAAALSHESAAQSAREQAAGAATLAELRARLEAFDGCALKASATQLVFADGAEDARVMLVGEGPGAEEDRAGKPFVGRAGQLLDKMFAAIGLDRSHLYIANVVPWRPPGNRTPTPQELALCLPFLRRQIELVAPDFLVLLGNASAQTLLGEKEGITRLRGHWREAEFGGRKIRALPMLHPAYLLRTPLKKAQAWRDLRALRHALDERA